MSKTPRSTLKIDRRSGRTSKRHKKSPSSLLCAGRPKPEPRVHTWGMTEAAKVHRDLWNKWLANPSRETFLDAYLSAYC